MLENQILKQIKQQAKEQRLGDKRAEQFYGLPKSAVYDPPNLANGSETTTPITVTGAVLGDFVIVSFSLDLQGIKLTAYVSSANVATCTFSNHTGGAVDLGSGTLKVRVFKQ